MIIPENKDPYGDYPTYLLANTQEEAEEMFIKYSALLNGISYTYSVSTGIEKGELFGEAVMGLAKALKNFDETLGYSFKTFAVKVIRRTLNEYARRNTYTIYVPGYIKRAHYQIVTLKRLLSLSGLTESQIDEVVRQGKTESFEIPTKFVDQCEKAIEFISREAERASIDYVKLVNRAESIPTEVELTDETVEEKHADDQSERDLEIALFVEKLKEHMTDTELFVCEGIMNDRTYEQIAEKLGVKRSRVRQILDKLKQKLTKRLRDGTITL